MLKVQVLISLCLLGLLAATAQSQEPQYREAVNQYGEAVNLVQRGEFDRAIVILQQIVDRAPNDLKAHNLMGIALSGAGRGTEASEQFKKVLELDPAFIPALKNLGVQELNLGQTEAAALHLGQALKLAPADPVCHWGLAEIAFREHQFQSAVDHYEHSGQMALKDPRVMVRFATSYMEIRQHAKAQALVESIPWNADPNSQFQSGLILAKLSKYDDARRRFELAEPGYPEPYDVAYNLLLLSVRQGDFSKAVQTGQAMLEKGYRKAELYNLIARAYAGSGMINEAYESLRQATVIEPLDETNYLDLIALCLEKGNYDRGLSIADIAVKLIPKSGALHVDRGAALALKGQFDEAANEFKAAEQLAPEGLAVAAMGLVLIQADRVPEAIAILKKHCDTGTSDPLVFWLLGEALYRSGPAPQSDAERQAVEALGKSIAMDAALAQPRALLGKIMLRRGELDRAQDNLEKAIQLDPDDVTTAYLLAQVYQKKGDKARASDLFARVEKAKTSDLETTRRNLLRIIKPAAQ